MLYLSQENELISKQQFQVLYFYAIWEPFHRKILIMLDKFEKKNPAMNFFSIDADHFRGLIKRFKIFSVPTVLVLREFGEVVRMENIFRTNDFISIFDDIYNLETKL